MGKIIYRCPTALGCPVVELTDDQMVKIHDPDKPEKGIILLTKEEWNDIKQNTPAV